MSVTSAWYVFKRNELGARLGRNQRLVLKKSARIHH